MADIDAKRAVVNELRAMFELPSAADDDVVRDEFDNWFRPHLEDIGWRLVPIEEKKRSWWSRLFSNTAGVPHHCRDCGAAMSYGKNGAGRWAALCPHMWLSLGDGTFTNNFPGHSVRITESKPDWGDCGHDHEERSLLRGYPV